MEYPSDSSPIDSSGVAASGGGEASLVVDPNSQPDRTVGSFQVVDDGVPSAPAEGGVSAEPADGVVAVTEAAPEEDTEFGFQRAEMGTEPLAGTVRMYDRHVFLCYKSPSAWPMHVEGAEFDRLPRSLAAEIKNSQHAITRKTPLTICEGEDGTDFSNGDLLIFPDMIRYRQMTHFDVPSFVEEVLIHGTEWRTREAQKLSGSYVFVCAHGSRDRRCGVCGPILIERFKEEIASRGLQGQIFVIACSHIGGHKYAGNVIIYSPNLKGEVTGHWYGYVTPDDVPLLLEQHIGEGKVVDRIWRGQMGLSEKDQKAAQNRRLHLDEEMHQNTQYELQRDGETNANTPYKLIEATKTDGSVNGSVPEGVGCCQGANGTTCCQALPNNETPESHDDEHKTQDSAEESNNDKKANGKSGTIISKICPLPSWFRSWEKEHTYTTIGVVVAIASVAVAYSCYRQLKSK